jgi:hypothetical protein
MNTNVIATIQKLIPRLRFASDWFLYSGVALIFVAASIPYAAKARRDASAIVRWHNQIEELASGEDVYLRHGYPNPPIMGLLLSPLAALPPVAGALLWYYAKAGMALLAFFWAFRLVETPQQRFPLGGKALVMLLSIRPMLGDLTHGNVNLFILFLVVAALVLFQRRWDFSSGMVLALAVACKVTPLLFVPYFLWKRAWKTLAGCAAGLMLFLWIVPACFLGWDRNVQLLNSWHEQMAKPYLVDGRVLYTAHANQSLPALIMRMTTASPSFTDYVDGELAPLRFDNVLDWDPITARWLVRGCMILFVGIAITCCRTSLLERRGWRLPAEFSLVILGMLLFSERTWKHHCVGLLLPLAVLVYWLATEQGTGLMRACLSAVLLLVATATLADNVLGTQADVYGAYTWGNFLLLMALAAVLVINGRQHNPNAVKWGKIEKLFRCIFGRMSV